MRIAETFTMTMHSKPGSARIDSVRIEGVDLARGLASLIMIQGHAYEGWVTLTGKESAAYAFTRFLGTFPLPSFLFLTGASLWLRTRNLNNITMKTARLSVMKRGLQLVMIGYASSFIYAFFDGSEGWPTLLRADVLHVIGLSLIALAAIGLRGKDSSRLLHWAIVLGVSVTLLCAPLSLWAKRLMPQHASSYPLALFVDIPPITRMPFVPLAAWTCAGVLACKAWVTHNRMLSLFSFALSIWFVAQVGLTLCEAQGLPLSRTNISVWFNLLELMAKSMAVLLLGMWITRSPAFIKKHLSFLGQHSLIAYVFHLPFAYGSFGSIFKNKLSMPEATCAVLLLMFASYAATHIFVKAKQRLQAYATPSPQCL